MNYEKWAFHDISPISQQLIRKLKYAILSNELSCDMTENTQADGVQSR